MSTIRELACWAKENDIEMLERRCFFCWKTGVIGGSWRGYSGEVIACPECAVEKLPLLIADSVSLYDPFSSLSRICGTFWRGVACRYMRGAEGPSARRNEVPAPDAAKGGG